MKEYIDIDGLFRKKNPGLYKWIPRFILNWIKKTVHQTDINEALHRNRNYRDAEFAERIIRDELHVKLTSTGLENIPESGGCIVAANHPLGGIDGMMLMVEASKVRTDVRVIVNDLLTALPNFGEIFIPINKLGAKGKQSMRMVDEAYSTQKLVLVFPAGLCSRKRNGVIKDLDWQKSFINRSIKYGLPVIPAFFSGKNSKRFYTVSRIRTFLKIKTNIEMFFLPDEMFKQKGKHVHIHFGKPIPAETFDNRQSQHQWAQTIKEYVYKMGRNKELNFNNFLENYDSNS
ncbi:MAG: 1-acyl-sn-glycerol-3-phosphate acyltransferase [Bacteroidetes bacterium]|nr:1-acyl-sn-glycerol-3-phosphate acyltransferase [Bacteroidota bacterium]